MLAPSVLAGRERELAILTRAIGTPSAICISGVPGIGKSTVLDIGAGLARAAGHAVLAAKASTAESDFAFGVVRQLFEPVLHMIDPHSLAARVIDGHPVDDEIAVLHALHRLATGMTPLFIAVDDVDAADVASLRWLAYLRRRTQVLPITLAMTVSTGGKPTDRALLIEVLAGANRLPLRPLDVDGCARVVRRALAPREVTPEFAGACHAATDGNPFLLQELLQAMANEDGLAVAQEEVTQCRPPWIADRLLARLRAQDPALAAVARVVAVLGTPQLEVVAAAARLPVVLTAEAAQSLASMDILRDGHRLEFRSSIMQATIAQGVSAVERDGVHARAAELLRARHAAPARIAAHLLQTTTIKGGWVADVLCAAGKQAIADGAQDLAVDCLRRALQEELDGNLRDEILLVLGAIEVPHDPDAAIEHLAAIQTHHAWARSLVDAVHAYAVTTRGEGAAQAADLALRAWRDGPEPAVSTACDAEFLTVLRLCYVVLTLTFADRLADARRCCAEAGRGGPLVAAVANTLTAFADLRAGNLKAAAATARAALESPDLGGFAGWLRAAVALPVLIEAAVDRAELEVAQDAIEYSNLNGVLPEHLRYCYLQYSRGLIHAACGELKQALDDQLECGRRFRENGILNTALTPWRAQAAMLHARLGHREQAAGLAAEDLAAARRWGAPRAVGIALRTVGLVRDGDERRALLSQAADELEKAGAVLELARTLCELGGPAELARARLLAGECGATALLAEIERRSPKSSTVLTPHERRIATMVVKGHTNRQIAKGLQVTPRAVELHLTKVYRKLGIERRAQLARALEE